MAISPPISGDYSWAHRRSPFGRTVRVSPCRVPPGSTTEGSSGSPTLRVWQMSRSPRPAPSRVREASGRGVGRCRIPLLGTFRARTSKLRGQTHRCTSGNSPPRTNNQTNNRVLLIRRNRRYSGRGYPRGGPSSSCASPQGRQPAVSVDDTLWLAGRPARIVE